MSAAIISGLVKHPFEDEVDRVITDLQGDLSKMKEVFDSGIMYRFRFNNIPIYVALPTYIPSRQENLVRVECEIGTVEVTDAGKLLLAITQDFDIHRHFPVRAIPRTKDCKTYTILLQVICSADSIHPGFVSQSVLYLAELAEYYIEQFFEQRLDS